MTALVAQEAPDFTAQAVMPDNSFAELTLSSYRGKYVVLVFYPLAFTSVCGSEINAFNEQLAQFNERDCQVIGVGVDSHFTQKAWQQVPAEAGGIGDIGYPLVSDLNKNIARAYNVLHNDALALRALFLINPKGIIRHMVVNDLPIARHVDEALRALDAVRFNETHGEACMANWKPEN